MHKWKILKTIAVNNAMKELVSYMLTIMEKFSAGEAWESAILFSPL
jgi:hypothetical protein